MPDGRHSAVLDWGMKRQRPAQTVLVCPKCGSSNVIPVVYGYPSPEGFAAAARGEIKLGGCVVGDYDWSCGDCGRDFPASIEC